MEAALTAQTPALAALYATFSLLHDEQPSADPPAGAEPPALPLWRRPRFAGVATLAVLALIVALCATLSVELRPSGPSCLAAGAAPAAATTAAAAQVRALDCGEYSPNK
jgi:ribose/xylose/arabinose/galactoside ABC-type transport system permease subunit